ncbi:hypothetical protein [Bryocella elongata]|nr:hypothetical protein [Bryocella elongata]
MPNTATAATLALEGKVTLGDTSPLGPALASFNGIIYIAWKGDGNDNLNVMCSTDDGHTFINKMTSPETSPAAPSLCVHNNTLFVAWRGDGGNADLNVARVSVAGDHITGLSNKVTLSDTSPFTPAIASSNGRLFIAWRGEGNTNLNVMYSSDNGASFGHKCTSSETSAQAPSLSVMNNTLYISWKGEGNDDLNVARVAMTGNDIVGLIDKAILSDTSPVSPSLTTNNGRLYLGWKGDGNPDLNFESSVNGTTFGGKYTATNEGTTQAIGMCSHDRKVYAAWKGNGNDNLNVAYLSGS